MSYIFFSQNYASFKRFLSQNSFCEKSRTFFFQSLWNTKKIFFAKVSFASNLPITHFLFLSLSIALILKHLFPTYCRICVLKPEPEIFISFRRALPGFSEYFNSLSDLPDNNARNPWYAEYYSTYCNCSLAENIKV